MFFKKSAIRYHEPLFRPPAEAESVIFQATYGCSWNQCSFCEMYTTKNFSVKKEDVLFGEIQNLGKLLPDARKVFLADGNPMVLSCQKLIRILDQIRKHFPKLRRVSTYALPSDILSKTDQELIDLQQAGLKLLYVGIESGDDHVLKLNNKSESYESTLKGLLKAKKAGFKLSLMILNGLGGEKYSEQHAVHSAKIINQIQPEYLSTLVLSFPYGLRHYQSRISENFNALSVHGLLSEMRLFVSETSLESTIFRSNHASNYLLLSGVLGRDQRQMLEQLDFAIQNPDLAGLRPEKFRGL